MISIASPTIEQILADDSWKSFPLELTPSGLEQFKKLTNSDSRKPIVYVHVEDSTGRVLRIGLARKGIHDRWTQATNGHIATFEWSMAYSETYKGMASYFPQYVLFFYRLANMKTTVWTVTCTELSAKIVEKILISVFKPVWEQFNSLCRAAGVCTGRASASTISDRTYRSSRLPVLDGLQSGRPWPLRIEKKTPIRAVSQEASIPPTSRITSETKFSTEQSSRAKSDIELQAAYARSLRTGTIEEQVTARRAWLAAWVPHTGGGRGAHRPPHSGKLVFEHTEMARKWPIVACCH